MKGLKLNRLLRSKIAIVPLFENDCSELISKLLSNCSVIGGGWGWVGDESGS